MIASAVASPAVAITSGIYSRRNRVSFPSESSAGLPSSCRKFFPTSSIIYPIEKKFVSLTNVAVDHLTAKVETKTNTTKQNQKNTNTPSSTFEPTKPKTSSSSRKEKNPKRLSSSGAHRTFLLPVIRHPLATESAMKAILEHNTLVFVVDERADKNSIKDTVKNVFKVRAKKVNTAITPDGTKKAYVMLAPDFSALDLAKMIKIL